MLGGRRFLLVSAVLAAGVLLALGFHLPFMRLSTLVLIGHGAQEHSLISAVHTLVRSNEVLLGGALLALAIFLPLLKLLYLLLLVLLPGSEIARAEALAWLGRWWPQDLVALAATAALVASRETLMQRVAGGAYCFAAAVLAMALAYAWRRGEPRLGGSPASKRWRAASRSQGFGALVALAALAYALGVTLPVVRLANAGAGSPGQSIIDLVLALQARGETVLWVVLAILALALPGLRVLYLVTVATARFLPSGIGSLAVRCAEALGPHGDGRHHGAEPRPVLSHSHPRRRSGAAAGCLLPRRRRRPHARCLRLGQPARLRGPSAPVTPAGQACRDGCPRERDRETLRAPPSAPRVTRSVHPRRRAPSAPEPAPCPCR